MVAKEDKINNNAFEVTLKDTAKNINYKINNQVLYFQSNIKIDLNTYPDNIENLYNLNLEGDIEGGRINRTTNFNGNIQIGEEIINYTFKSPESQDSQSQEQIKPIVESLNYYEFNKLFFVQTNYNNVQVTIRRLYYPKDLPNYSNSRNITLRYSEIEFADLKFTYVKSDDIFRDGIGAYNNEFPLIIEFVKDSKTERFFYTPKDGQIKREIEVELCNFDNFEDYDYKFVLKGNPDYNFFSNLNIGDSGIDASLEIINKKDPFRQYNKVYFSDSIHFIKENGDNLLLEDYKNGGKLKSLLDIFILSPERQFLKNILPDVDFSDRHKYKATTTPGPLPFEFQLMHINAVGSEVAINFNPVPNLILDPDIGDQEFLFFIGKDFIDEKNKKINMDYIDAKMFTKDGENKPFKIQFNRRISINDLEYFSIPFKDGVENKFVFEYGNYQHSIVYIASEGFWFYENKEILQNIKTL